MKTCWFCLLPLSSLLLSHQADGLDLNFKKLPGTNSACDAGPDVMTTSYAAFTEGLPIPQFCIKNPVANGKPRCYYLFVPKCASGKVPLVVNMHGTETCPLWSSFFDRWLQTSVRNCFAVAYPIGIMDPDVADAPCMTFPGGKSVSGGFFTANDCCCYKGDRALKPSETLDMIVIRNIVQDIASQKRVSSLSMISNGNAELDGTRIYMAGHSNGCIAALSMAALYSDLVAAVACHAAGSIADFPSYYDPVPTWIAQGQKDDRIWFQFTRDTTLTLATKHECKRDTSKLVGNRTAVEYSHHDCKNNASVTLLLLNNSGHMPFLDSFEVTVGASPTKIDTTQMAWEFCSNYSKSDIPKALLYASSAVGYGSIMWSSGGVALSVAMFVSMMLC